MDYKHPCGAVLLFCLCFQAVVFSQEEEQCRETCPGGSSDPWASGLGAVAVEFTSARISWDPDFQSEYVVRYRVSGTQDFITTDTVSVFEITLANLTAGIQYDVEVCRAMPIASRSDNCGGCLYCLVTPRFLPGIPIGITTTSTSQSLRVEWLNPSATRETGIISYNITCTAIMPVSSEVTVNQLSNQLPATFLSLPPGTTFNCSVVAVNMIGPGPPAFINGSTLPRETEPGALLIFANGTLEYIHVVNGMNPEPHPPIPPFLFTPGDTMRGMDYNFQRTVLYYTIGGSSPSLLQLQMNMMTTADGRIVLTNGTGVPTVLVTAPAGSEYTHVAVDWVHNDIYYVETQEAPHRNRIMRLQEGSNSGPRCVLELSETITNIAVDPVHGYFYWSTERQLLRAILSSIQPTSNGCQTSPSEPPLLLSSLGPILTFTIEHGDNDLYYRGQFNCSTTGSLVSAVIAISLEGIVEEDGDVTSSFITSFPESSLLESYTQTAIVTLERNRAFFFPTGTSALCPTQVGPQVSGPLSGTAILLRMFRSTKQPLPVPPDPPSSVRVSTTSDSAILTWQAPQFIGNIFSPDAFDSWEYIVRYCTSPQSNCEELRTTSLSLTVPNLTPDTTYFILLTVSGLGGSRSIPNILVSRTKPFDFFSAQLLVSHNLAVQRSTLTGENVADIGGISSSESNANAHDGFTNITYWSIEGGQGDVYMNAGGSPVEDATILYSNRDNPSNLEYDWLGKRLFWVEEERSELQVVFGFPEDLFISPVVLHSVPGVQSTALDAFNGVLFWTNEVEIRMLTLSGIDVGVCFSPPLQATSLAVDVQRTRLYWLSSNQRPGEPLTLSQMEYNSTSCNPASIKAQELSQVTFSSTSTILAYGSNTLFISNRGSNLVYSVSSEIGSAEEGEALATGSVQFSGSTLEDIRDIVVGSSSLQPLPAGISANERSLDLLRPSPPPEAPVLGSGSTTNTIVIEWAASSGVVRVPGSPIFYSVEYSLNKTSGMVVSGSEMTTSTSITLSGQEASTVVTATVTAFSQWTKSDPSPTGVFTSLPNRPAQVRNVRVHVFRPNTNQSVVTGLVTWDGIDDVNNYTVSVTLNGEELPNLYRSPFPDTTYVILERDDLGAVNYLLMGRTYAVQVTAMNEAGAGIPSDSVNFTTDGPNYPQQVLTVGENGQQFLGESPEINQNLSIADASTLVVDTIGRNVYWYSSTSQRIYSQSLNTGSQQPFLVVPSDQQLLSLAFDWIGECIYMLRRQLSTGRLEVHRVLIYDTDRLYNVFPDLEDTGSADATYQMIMNPFTGFLYWVEVSSQESSLHQLNLRTPNSTDSFVLSQSRRRRRETQRFRRQSLSSLSLTSALTQDPMTGELLVSDATSGDILRCNPNSMICSVEVEGASLMTTDNMAVTGDAGLPATSLALNEQRLYWTRAGSPGVYAVDLSARNVLLVISGTVNVRSVNTLSPGQQVIPANAKCLSPDFINARPELRENVPLVTNTTVFLAWDVVAKLPEMCNNVVFSVPAYTYLLQYAIVQTQFLFNMFTRRTCFQFTNLQPDTSYFFHVSVHNEFTTMAFPEQMFDEQTIQRTAEGVPLPPTGLTANVTGTASVQLVWDEPTRMELLGSTVRYFLFLENGVEDTIFPNLTLDDSSLLTRGETNTIQLIIHNGVLNSSSVSINAALWPLVPLPRVITVTNNSFVVNVTLPDREGFGNIISIACLACEYRLATPMPQQRCICPSEDIMEDNDFVRVNSLPFSGTFDISNLTSFTSYCIQAVGFYGTETTPGIGLVQRTRSGIPDAPSTTLVDTSILMWTEPTSNGDPIQQYMLTARQPGISIEDNSIVIIVRAPETQFDLDNNQLSLGVLYEVVVTAINSNGEGPPSEAIEYMRVGPPLTLPEIAGISVAGAAIISIIAIILIIICFVQCRSTKRELRSLSYMYGPDHELSNLRDAYRNAQSSNPHYTWSREDYVCTEEDLSLLNKFPRNNLKLENFIDRGEFGEVFQGTATDILGVATGPTPVAVKTLRKGATPEEQNKFLSEAALMANFNHPNIVKVLGVCVDNDPVYIIMELMPGGDLLKFLRDAKMDHGPTLLTLTEQIQVAVDVAHGCHYLEQQHFIHRDIAARNCLVSSKGSDRVVKIGDFGLAKDLYSSDYYQVEGQRKLPVRWMAPEALLQGKFTVESDIWSYGVLLWEIMTLGNQPYPGRINQEVLQFVTGGGRLDRPDKCPSKIYHLMQNCWKRYSSDRPHFETILNTLNGYMDRLKRPDSVYYSDSDTDEEGGENNVQRQGSGKLPSRTPSIREGIINLARSGSMKLRNSFRRHNSVHKREEHHANSQEDNSSAFRERGPF